MNSPQSRARTLSSRLRPETVSPNDRRQLDDDLRATAMERSPVWFCTLILAIVGILLVGGSVWWIYQKFWPREVVRRVGDARYGSDYREHAANGWVVVDQRNAVIATKGGGAERFRLDGGASGFWETFDPQSTGGLLPEANIRQVHFNGRRLWFVGDKGSLSSCDKSFTDWKTHFGGKGFVGGLDLREGGALTSLATSSDQKIFAVGAKDCGLGVYDVVTRQWLTLRADEGMLYTDHVNAVCLHGQWVFIGTTAGLNVHRFDRSSGLPRLIRRHDMELPPPYTERPVRALRIAGDTIHCMVGNGGHLEMDIAGNKPRWRVLTREADAALASLNGRAVVPEMAPAGDGFWLALPEFGPAFYDAGTDHLELRNQGLSDGNAPCLARSVRVVDVGDGRADVWSMVRAQGSTKTRVWRWIESAWSPLTPADDDAVEFQFAGRRPVVRMADGTVRAYSDIKSLPLGASGVLSIGTAGGLPSSTSVGGILLIVGVWMLGLAVLYVMYRYMKARGLPWILRSGFVLFGMVVWLWAIGGIHWFGRVHKHVASEQVSDDVPAEVLPIADAVLFKASPCGPQMGPAEVANGQLYVGRLSDGRSGEMMARYVPARRGWQAVPCNNGYAFKQIRTGGETLWAVKQNGEAGKVVGFTGALDSPSYQSVMGPSAQTNCNGNIITAAFHDNFWFARNTPKGVGMFVYRCNRRSIEEAGEGLDGAFAPLQLRGAGDTIYAWGRKAGNRIVYATDAENRHWRERTPSGADIDQFVVAGANMICRSTAGEVHVYPGSQGPTTLLRSCDNMRWKRLLPDRFGRLWGLGEDGSVWVYHPGQGSWDKLRDVGSTRDLILFAVDDVDFVLAGTASGLVTWKSIEGQAIKAEEDEKLKGKGILSLDSDGRRIWALVASKNVEYSPRELRTRGLDDKEWKTVWQMDCSSGPESAEIWNNVIWADLVDGELWFVDRPGTLYRYDIETSKWYATTHLSGQPQHVQRSSSGMLWWLDTDGSLRALMPDGDEPAKELSKVIFRDIGATGSLNEFDGCPAYRSWTTSAIGFCRFIFTILVLGVLAGLLVILFNALRRRGFVRAERPVVLFFVSLCIGMILVQGIIMTFNSWGEEQARFEGLHFVKKVRAFAVEDDELRVETARGVWVFDCSTDGLVRPQNLDSRHGRVKQITPAYPIQHSNLPWRIHLDGGKLAVWRQNSDGDPLRCHPGAKGFAEDAISRIAIVGDTLVAQTPVGLAEYDTGYTLEFRHFKEIENATGHLAKLNDQVYFVLDNSADKPLKYVGGTSHWIAVRSPWPLTKAVWGVQWTHWSQQVKLSSASFDSQYDRLLADVCEQVIADKIGRLWLKTLGGWRRCDLGGGRVQLSKLQSDAPQPASPVTERKISNFRISRRVARTDGDDLTFFFTPLGRQPESNVFTAHGRWPDEDIHAVLPHAGDVWLATAKGLLHISGDDEKFFLAGKDITSLDRLGNEIYCRTDSEVYRYDGRTWAQVDLIPANLFSPKRTFRVSLGRSVGVTAIETNSGKGPETVLSPYDSEQGRFTHDVVQEILGGTEELWALTPEGIQKMRLDQHQVADHIGYLTDNSVIGIRRGASGGVYAVNQTQSTWRYDGRDIDKFVPAEADNNNPFVNPPRGRVSNILYWQRDFRVGGDKYEIQTVHGPVVFTNGKLGTYVLDGTRFGSLRYQATPSGIIVTDVSLEGQNSSRLFAWPRPWQAGDRRLVAIDRRKLFCYCQGAAYQYDFNNGNWQPGKTLAFHFPKAVFNGLNWQFGLNSDGPSLLYSVAAGDGYSSPTPTTIPDRYSETIAETSKLNSLGQFPFDAIRSVAHRGGKLWLSHGTGIAVYAGPTDQSRLMQCVQAWHWECQQPLLFQTDHKGAVWVDAGQVGKELRHYSVVTDSDDPRNGPPFQPPPEDGRNPFNTPPQWSGTIDGVVVVAQRSAKSQKTVVLDRGSNDRITAEVDVPVLDIRWARSNLWMLTERGLYLLQP